jgi:1-acyl-sn-glycerol-3-phosphate acyltransferase
VTPPTGGPHATDWRHHLPRSSDAHPATWMLRGLRPPARRLLAHRFDVTVHDAEHVPDAGPVILAANHVGIIDGPLLTVFAPRPVHALTKREMFVGRLGHFLLRSGQIPVERYDVDPGAVKSTLRVLRDGGAVGIFPEGTRGDGELRRFHHGAAYLAAVTGAPVVPVTFLGTRLPGGHINSVPPRGASIDIVFGTAWSTDRVPWPRRREELLVTSRRLMEHMHGTLSDALGRTGRSLPGPLPGAEHGDDPDTGFVEPTREPGAS